jgi:hypothetical protein
MKGAGAGERPALHPADRSPPGGTPAPIGPLRLPRRTAGSPDGRGGAWLTPSAPAGRGTEEKRWVDGVLAGERRPGL